MKIMSKFSILLIVILLVLHTLNVPVSASTEIPQKESLDSIQATTISTSDSEDELIPVYEESNPESSKILTKLQVNDVVNVIERQDTFSLVEYNLNSTSEQYLGFIRNDNLLVEEDTDTQNTPSEDSTELSEDGENISVEEEEPNNATDETENSMHEDKELDSNSEESKTISNDQDSTTANEKEELIEDESEEVKKAPSLKMSKQVSTYSNEKAIYGIALKKSTNVYLSQSANSQVLKSYDNGSVLKFKKMSSQWYEASVYVGGKYTTGYIYVEDVELIVTTQSTLHGIGLKSNTPIYSKAATDSKILKDYPEGKILKFKTFSPNWYEATVMVGGDYIKGYIHIEDVEPIVESKSTLYGVAKEDQTPVYQLASVNSTALKAYDKGAVLKYNTFSSEWYEATVYVNGKPQTGYIHKSHVENAASNQESLKGIGLRSPTSVYSDASVNSNKLKSYSKGTVLSYRTFTTDWYEATVYINGKSQTGYIHKSHVENPVSNQETLKGIGLRSPTSVYSDTSVNSNKLKSYSKGTILSYRTFTTDWYEAIVYINGKPQTGYIHKSHVENAVSNQESLKGIGLSNPTPVYSDASMDASKLKSYPAGSILYYKTFSSNWYEATVYVNGNKKTGYIHSSHVEGTLPSQKTLEGRGTSDPTKVYSLASKRSDVLKSYSYGSKLKFKSFTKNWYQATVYINNNPVIGYIHAEDVATGDVTKNTKYNSSFSQAVNKQLASGTPKSDGAGKVSASRGEVEYYLNPANFSYGTSSYFQFLVLSQSAGLDANEINSKVLFDKGILKGTAEAFIQAGNLYHINDAYLISHVLHETGNGTSTLSNGIPVDDKGNVTRNKNGEIDKTPATAHTVYNMYGYGAVDNNPIGGGAKYAFNHGWFTPEQAIIGGASEVSTNYIQKGQDTLYKMKWNPEAPATHQYATHVQWAKLQTTRIFNIYNLLENYTLVFDIPEYQNQPNYDDKLYGITQTTGNLNFRSGPGTGNSIIGTIPSKSRIEILGTDSGASGWYNIRYNGAVGWVSAKYVNLSY